jgi:signal peptidase II
VLPSLGIRAPDPESDPHLNPDQTHSIEQGDGSLGLKRAGFVTAMAALSVVVLDQVAKALIVAWIGPDQMDNRWELAGRMLAFEYVENTGAAFGILAGRVWLLSVLALLVGGGFLIAFRKELRTSRPIQIGIGFILGGATGNLIDRLRLGYVVDYIAAGTWPKFNIADSAITIGLLLMAWTVFRDETTRENTE